MKSKILFICILSLFIFSCEKKTVCHSLIEAAGRKEVCLTETIKLTAYGKGKSTQNYEWTGPNNFSATGTSIEIPMADYNMAGKYSVRATDNQDCTSDYYYFDITVKDIIAPCSLPVNSNESNNGYYGDHYDLIPNAYVSGNYYVVTMGDLGVSFLSPNIPTDGVYEITSNIAEAGQMRAIYDGYYICNTGSLAYVKTIDGHLTITFCDVCFDWDDRLLSTHIVIP